jgi:hypothetical protein
MVRGMADDEVRITLPMSEDMLRRVDEARRGLARTVWIRRAIEMGLAVVEPPQDDLFAPLTDTLAGDEPDAVVTAAVHHEAVASVALDGETHVVDDGAVHQGVAGHLHRAEKVGAPYRTGPGGILLIARRCKDCGADLPPGRG